MNTSPLSPSTTEPTSQGRASLTSPVQNSSRQMDTGRLRHRSRTSDASAASTKPTGRRRAPRHEFGWSEYCGNVFEVIRRLARKRAGTDLTNGQVLEMVLDLAYEHHKLLGDDQLHRMRKRRLRRQNQRRTHTSLLQNLGLVEAGNPHGPKPPTDREGGIGAPEKQLPGPPHAATRFEADQGMTNLNQSETT